ncbi:hypothetical protein B0H17DRAFT_1209290 [Mycena rosella]|uniref:WD40 repeat-like protein n=1 Tax=Mycena rosella TaxID=1033263 RepID=A0AAD7G9Q2_MYCRO|nr:hypothetical protein B0H17DRAFT_1209290 [Mycena rosella]
MPRRPGDDSISIAQSHSHSSIPKTHTPQTQAPRPRTSVSATNIVNFAPPPVARRPSWFAPSPSAMSLPERRPSWTPLPLPDASGGGSGRKRMRAVDERGREGSASAGVDEGSEEAGNFRKGLQTDMKRLVGDAVGNMSISPTARDIVLAARRGLFIIDLEAPALPPAGRHVGRRRRAVEPAPEPRGVHRQHERGEAPHLEPPPPLARARPLLASSAPSAIQHVLHVHYRAITDINWHPTLAERDLIVSTAVDAWVWVWDLRAARGGRAVFGLSTFNSGGLHKSTKNFKVAE